MDMKDIAYMTDLRGHLRSLMKEKNVTIKDLSAKLDVRAATLSDYLNDKHSLSTDTYERAIKFLKSLK